MVLFCTEKKTVFSKIVKIIPGNRKKPDAGDMFRLRGILFPKKFYFLINLVFIISPELRVKEIK